MNFIWETAWQSELESTVSDFSQRYMMDKQSPDPNLAQTLENAQRKLIWVFEPDWCLMVISGMSMPDNRLNKWSLLPPFDLET